MYSSKFNYLSKAHLLMSSYWGVGLQHINLRGPSGSEISISFISPFRGPERELSLPQASPYAAPSTNWDPFDNAITAMEPLP